MQLEAISLPFKTVRVAVGDSTQEKLQLLTNSYYTRMTIEVGSKKYAGNKCITGS